MKKLAAYHAAARDLKLVVPGTYRRTAEPVYIQSFAPQLVVINSKQRPRRYGWLL